MATDQPADDGDDDDGDDAGDDDDGGDIESKLAKKSIISSPR